MRISEMQKKGLVLVALFIGFLAITFRIWPFNNLTAADQWVLIVVDVASMAGYLIYCGLCDLIDTAARHGERKYK